MGSILYWGNLVGVMVRTYPSELWPFISKSVHRQILCLSMYECHLFWVMYSQMHLQLLLSMLYRLRRHSIMLYQFKYDKHGKICFLALHSAELAHIDHEKNSNISE